MSINLHEEKFMKSEAYKLWEQALNSFRNAEENLKNGNSQQASKDATAAALIGCQALTELSKELQIPDLSVISNNALLDCCERIMSRKHYTPNETVEWSRRTLKRLHSETPEDTFQPLI
jgi:hypothetical protein